MGKILLLTLLASLGVIANGDTPTYTFGDIRATWYQAQILCASKSATLAKISAADEYSSAVTALVEGGGGDVWLGGNRATGTWNWADNTRVIYNQWNRGQPSLRGGNCLAMGTNLKWYARNCNTRRYYLCATTSTS